MVMRYPRDADERLKAWKQFAANFQPSSRGNVWCEYGDMTLSVFKRDGAFHWLIVFSDQCKRYSQRRYDNEEDALFGLWQEIS